MKDSDKFKKIKVIEKISEKKSKKGKVLRNEKPYKKLGDKR